MVRRHCAIGAGFLCAFSPPQEIRRRKLLMGDVISEARHLSLANWMVRRSPHQMSPRLPNVKFWLRSTDKPPYWPTFLRLKPSFPDAML